jgi:hypothetical protein
LLERKVLEILRGSDRRQQQILSYKINIQSIIKGSLSEYLLQYCILVTYFSAVSVSCKNEIIMIYHCTWPEIRLKKSAATDAFVLPVKMLILVPVYSWHLAVSEILSCCFIDWIYGHNTDPLQAYPFLIGMCMFKETFHS